MGEMLRLRRSLVHNTIKLLNYDPFAEFAILYNIKGGRGE